MPLRSPRTWGEASDLVNSALTDPMMAQGGLGAFLQQLLSVGSGTGKTPFDLPTQQDLSGGGINTRGLERQQKHAQRQDIQAQRHDIQQQRRDARHGGGMDGGGGGRAGGIVANWRAAHGGGPGGSPGGSPGGGNPMLSHPAVAFGQQMAGAGPGGGAAAAIRQKVASALGAKGMSQDASGTWHIAGLAQPVDPGRMMRDAAIRSMGGPGWAERVNGADQGGWGSALDEIRAQNAPSSLADSIVGKIRGSQDLTGATMASATGAAPGSTDALVSTLRGRLAAPDAGTPQQIMADVLGHIGQQRGVGSTPSTDALVSAIRQQVAARTGQSATGAPPSDWPANRLGQNPMPPTGQPGPLTQGQVAQQTPTGLTPAQVSQENRNMGTAGEIPFNGQAVGSTTTQAPLANTTPGYADTAAAPAEPQTAAAPQPTDAVMAAAVQAIRINEASDAPFVANNAVDVGRRLPDGSINWVDGNTGIFLSTAQARGIDWNRLMTDPTYGQEAIGIELTGIANDPASAYHGPEGMSVWDWGEANLPGGGWEAVGRVYLGGDVTGQYTDELGMNGVTYGQNFVARMQAQGIDTSPGANAPPGTQAAPTAAAPGQTNTGWGGQPIPGNPGGYHGSTPAPMPGTPAPNGAAPGSSNTVWGGQPFPGSSYPQPAPNGAAPGGPVPQPVPGGNMDPRALPPPTAAAPGATPPPLFPGSAAPAGPAIDPTTGQPRQTVYTQGPNAQLPPGNPGIPTAPPPLPPGVILNAQGIPVDDPNVPRQAVPPLAPGTPPLGVPGSQSTTTPAVTTTTPGVVQTAEAIASKPEYGVKAADGSDQSWMMQQGGLSAAPAVNSKYDDPYTIGPWYGYQEQYGAPGDVHAAYDIGYAQGTPISGVQNLTGTVECVSCGSYCTGGIATDGSLYCDGVGVGQINVNIDPQTQGGNQITMIYGHMLTSNVSAGDRVDVGTAIGTTGYAGSGPHLHEEARAYCPSGCSCPGGGTSSGWRIIDPGLVANGYYQSHNACTDQPL